ncbi:MAG: formimidoylglutamase [Pseudomonadota bacterium]
MMIDQIQPYDLPKAPADKKGDPRLRNWHSSESSDSSVLIGHYPDDEGVEHNGGRIGAREAPSKIMKYLLKMTPPAFSKADSFPNFHVVGSPKSDLPHFEKLEAGRQLAKAALSEDKKWIGIGGGHDYGYSDGAGFLDVYKGSEKATPLVINFDAHLDVRPFNKDAITSGTPFSRLLEMDIEFDFLEIGVREFCNSAAHALWAQDKGAKILTLEALRDEANSTADRIDLISQTLSTGSHQPQRPCFLSVDIDAFTSDSAMGCSQSWPTGMTTAEFWPLMKWILKTFDVKTLGVYEVSPPLDQDDRTSKLAAEIIDQYLFHLSEPIDDE